jgi:hypothetical protein
MVNRKTLIGLAAATFVLLVVSAALGEDFGEGNVGGVIRREVVPKAPDTIGQRGDGIAADAELAVQAASVFGAAGRVLPDSGRP